MENGGGNLFVFETNSKEFKNVDLGNFQINLWPIKSFFEDSSSIYLSAGLQHMTTNGVIVKFEGLKASVLLESRSSWSTKIEKDSSRTMIDGSTLAQQHIVTLLTRCTSILRMESSKEKEKAIYRKLKTGKLF